MDILSMRKYFASDEAMRACFEDMRSWQRSQDGAYAQPGSCQFDGAEAYDAYLEACEGKRRTQLLRMCLDNMRSLNQVAPQLCDLDLLSMLEAEVASLSGTTKEEPPLYKGELGTLGGFTMYEHQRKAVEKILELPTHSYLIVSGEQTQRSGMGSGISNILGQVLREKFAVEPTHAARPLHIGNLKDYVGFGTKKKAQWKQNLDPNRFNTPKKKGFRK